MGRVSSMARGKSRMNTMDDMVYDRQVQICKAFAHSSRLKILDLLASGELTGTELQEALGLAQANVSQHLAILKAAGVVATRRDGNQVYCSLTMPEVKQACQLIRDVLRVQVRNGQKLV